MDRKKERKKITCSLNSFLSNIHKLLGLLKFLEVFVHLTFLFQELRMAKIMI